MASDMLKVTDTRTGKAYDLPITHGTINAMELRGIKVDADDFGLMSYDPAFKNTASCKSTITFIDGEKGILEYRGYPIDDLAGQSSHMEASYLILNGKLPSADELASFNDEIVSDMTLHEGVRRVIKSLPHDAHPMAALQTATAALGIFNPESSDIEDPEARRRHTRRLIAQMPVMAAEFYRHSNGLPDVTPNPELGYTGNFLAMLHSKGGKLEAPDPVLTRALDMLFLLHIDHEQNCSTSSMRAIGSSDVNPYAAVAGAIGALFGPRHGGANEAVVNMLREIETTDNIPGFLAKVKSRDVLLMGFGHRVYKNFDPRATAIKAMAPKVFEATGFNPLIDIARELERTALEDDFFAGRKLFPNVDFYSGIIYEAMGFKADLFTVLFTIARTVGWLSQWNELIEERQPIARPRQVYLGDHGVKYVPMRER